MPEAAEIKKRIYARLEGLGMKDEKENIVFSFTSGRTSHLSAMEEEELLSLLEKLGGHVTNTDNLWGKFDRDNKQHLYLLSMCHQLGWITFNHKIGYNVADLTRLGRWIKNFGSVKKPLMEQDLKELQQTIYQMEMMVMKHFKK